MMRHSLFMLILATLLLAGCASPPPRDVNNICNIFRQYPSWQRDAESVARRWHVPVPVQMAIIHQESRFDSRAQPARTKLLWIIPWKRPSTAYGYSQALKTTWDHYRYSQGSIFASRTDFSDAVDFIGWYANEARLKAGIRPDDAFRLYLAYHEGIGGYQRGTWRSKNWLVPVAHKVSARAQSYQMQLAACKTPPSRFGFFK